MYKDYQEALADEMGYIMCPIVGSYTACDADCEECDYYIGFTECVNDRDSKKI